MLDFREHKKGVKLLIESGVISLGGPTLVSHPLVGEPQINGSVLLLNADTQEEILEIVRQDIYTTSGVWDLQNVRRILSLAHISSSHLLLMHWANFISFP